jgi:NADH dehydrogenase [ubiquinone] 1 alpha subcomplex assembly factor 7
MAIALGHPENGYYRKADPLGAAGDFITSPEISQIFGEIIGLWAAVTWQQAGAPSLVRLVELGPGRGTLMADALRAANNVPGFAQALAVHLVETSPVLRDRQRQALAKTQVEWHESLSDIPAGPAIIIANEFFDALPTNQYVRTPEGWRERRIEIDDDADCLAFIATDDAPPPGTIPSELAKAPVGSMFEHSPNRQAECTELGHRLAAEGIAALIIDYGHALPGIGETLQAVRRHQPHDVLSNAGEVDLTTHVDFSAVADAARGAGARSWPPLSQGSFLTALGAEQRTESLASAAAPDQAANLRTGLKRLIAADGMGTLFKVMALTGADAPPPAGFETTGMILSE